MIYLSYGMPKSASTFCYQIAEAMLRQAGHVREEICEKFLPAELHPAFMTFQNDEILRLVEYVPPDKILIIKTHSWLNPPIDTLLRSGKIKASATFRDPRDAAISVLDSGERDRKLNLFRKFNEIQTMDDAFIFYKNIKNCILQWLIHPDPLKISYSLLANDPAEAAMRLRNYLNIDADVASVVEKFSGDLKKKVWEFNVGKIGRYREYMTDEQVQKFNQEFGDLIDVMNDLDDRYKIGKDVH